MRLGIKKGNKDEKFYKRFKYDLEYKDGYYNKVMYTLILLFIFCMIMVIIL